MLNKKRATPTPSFSGGPSVGAQPCGCPRAARKRVTASRFAWTLAHGQIPDGLDVLHSCDVSICCEPDHLRLGTDTDNTADRTARFVNAAGGEGHGLAKLTHREAREIYDLTRGGPHSQRAVAELYGITSMTVSRIHRGLARQWSVAVGWRA